MPEKTNQYMNDKRVKKKK